MKVAIIAPIPLLSEYARTDYHLTLSHLVFDSYDYRTFYHSRSQAGDFVILDNSAHEFGEGTSVDTLLSAQRAIQASEVVVPDKLFDGAKTVDLAFQTVSELRARLPRGVRLMGVPQGSTVDEWRWSLEVLLCRGVDTIGISKDYEWWHGGLLERIYQVRETAKHLRAPVSAIHMLGWGRHLRLLSTISQVADHPTVPIRGIDSAKPLVYAASKILLESHREPRYPERPSDFFNLSSLPAHIAVKNCEMFQQVANV